MLTRDDLTDALLEELARHPAGEDAPFVGYIDGALAGLLLAPDPVPDDEWLRLLGAGPDVAFADPLDRERFVGLLRDRKAEIATELLQGGLAFAPVYDFGDDSEEPLWQFWLLGFGSALALHKDNWEAVVASDDEDTATAAMGLMSLLASLPGFAAHLPEGEELPDIDEFIDEAPDLIPYLVETIYRRQRGLEREVLADGWTPGFDDPFEPAPAMPVRSTKIGRNAPCPCGSGRKYKKCCGR